MSKKATKLQKTGIGILGVLLLGIICYYAAFIEKTASNNWNIFISCILVLAAMELIYAPVPVEKFGKAVKTNTKGMQQK